jgi:iron complex outermembrane receptor protein
MLRPLLLGTAMILAVPALAQTTPPGADVAKPGLTGTGQDSTSAGQNGVATTGVGNPEMGTTATAQTEAHARCAPATRHMSAAAKRARAACRETASVAATGDSGWGLGAGAATSTTYTGQGGPYEPARAYPVCSRTVRDSCRNRGGK